MAFSATTAWEVNAGSDANGGGFETSGTTDTSYNPDGSVMRQFTVNSQTAPTQRI